MGLLGKSRKKRRDEDDFDLLSAAFNLPTRQTIQRTLERDAQRRSESSSQPDHHVFVYSSKSQLKDNTCDFDSDTAIDSEPETDSVASSSGPHVVIQHIKKKRHNNTPEVSTRQTRKSSPPSTPIRSSRRSHRRGESEPQGRSRKLIEAEPACTPATEPQPSRQQKRREQRALETKSRRVLSDGTTSEGSSVSEGSSITTSHKQAEEPPPSFIQGLPVGMASPFAHQHYQNMPANLPFYPQTYRCPWITTNQGPSIAHVHGDPFGAQGPAQLQYSNHLLYPGAVPYPLGLSGYGALPTPLSKASELQRIQQDLDVAIAAQNASPHEPSLQARCSALTNLLNTTLNQASGQKYSPDKTTTGKIEDSGVQEDQGPNKPTQKEQAKSDQDDTRHHICDGCGNLRSRHYHEMHPLAPGKPKHPSLCEGCREVHYRPGVTGSTSQHVCFGCGIFRSNTFNRKNPVQPDKPLLANLCGRCELAMREADDDVSSIIVLVSLTTYCPCIY